MKPRYVIPPASILSSLIRPPESKERRSPLTALLQKRRYLKLMNPGNRPGTLEALAVAEEIAAALDDADTEIAKILWISNWRHQLVAGVTLLFVEPGRELLDALWVDIGVSWVSPQLAAVAYLKDPEFEPRARERIERLGAVYVPDQEGYRSPKSVSALVALCRELPEVPAWLAAQEARPELQELLRGDVDRGGGIATGWLRDMRAALAAHGVRPGLLREGRGG
jgi:hypothetical protein